MPTDIVCLDANILIAVFQDEEDKAPASLAVLREIREGRLRAVCPTLLLLEVRQPPVWEEGPFSLADYLRAARIQLRALDIAVIENLKRVPPHDTRGRFFRDHVYLATAVTAHATHFFTWDDDYKRRVREYAGDIVISHPEPPNRQISLL